MRPTTAWQAITAGPRTFLRSAWPWRALAYIVTSAALYAAAAVAVVALVVAGVLLAAFLVGFAALVACVLLGPFVADVERRRLAMVDDSPAERPPLALPTGFWRRLRRRLRDERTWREFGFLLLNIVSLWVVDVVVVVLVVVLPVGLFWSFLVDPAGGFVTVLAPLLVLLLAPVCAYVVTAWAAARGAVTRAVLAPRVTEDGLRLQEVSRSRSRLVGAFDTERARLERDLHDGAQQRLVLLKVHLGMAALDLPPGSAALGGIALAQQEAALALEDLREVTRGLSPRVLRDRGLADAVRDVTGRLPLPVTLDLTLPAELPEAVETAGYYALSEALTNVVKHSQATRACVRGRSSDGWLRLEVSDDGVGGARIGAGMGLTGIADRVHAVDGRVFLSSPGGGPTTLRIELPCPSA